MSYHVHDMSLLLFLDIVMLTRLVYLRSESPTSLPKHWLILSVQVLFLLALVPSWQILGLAASLITIAVATQIGETRGHNLTGVRTLSFLATAGAGVLLLQHAEPAVWISSLLNSIGRHTLWTESLDPSVRHQGLAMIFGLLLLTNEVNLWIRYAFYRLNLEPRMSELNDGVQGKTSSDTDLRQYSAGRVIGILERYLIFTLLMAGADYSVIALILAAKGFARFKQLDRREFAEYVLIGTLASTLCAVVAALAVAALI